jgi:hypothetical protein
LNLTAEGTADWTISLNWPATSIASRALRRCSNFTDRFPVVMQYSNNFTRYSWSWTARPFRAQAIPNGRFTIATRFALNIPADLAAAALEGVCRWLRCGQFSGVA